MMLVCVYLNCECFLIIEVRFFYFSRLYVWYRGRLGYIPTEYNGTAIETEKPNLFHSRTEGAVDPASVIPGNLPSIQYLADD